MHQSKNKNQILFFSQTHVAVAVEPGALEQLPESLQQTIQQTIENEKMPRENPNITMLKKQLADLDFPVQLKEKFQETLLKLQQQPQKNPNKEMALKWVQEHPGYEIEVNNDDSSFSISTKNF